MKRLELYFMRAAILVCLLAIAASPVLALGHFFQGVAQFNLDITHLVSLGYLVFIMCCVFLISPAFGENES